MQNVINGTYRILEEIGHGGGGTVYLAMHLRLQRKVVLKKMHASLAGRVDRRSEADILKNLRHFCLPQVLDFVEDGEDVYTVMEYIEGPTLKQLLDRGKVFSEEEAAAYGEQLLDALEYLHTRRVPIIHGDVKPSNIIVTPQGSICLIDFNVSGYLTDGSVMTVGYSKGYASPEQVRAVRSASGMTQRSRQFSGNTRSTISTVGTSREDVLIGSRTGVTPRSDLYSAGAVLYSLVTGQRPAEDFLQIVPLSEHRGISDSFAAVVDRAMSPDPAKRYASAAEMREALRTYPKKDTRYRRRTLYRRLLFGVATGIAAGCIFFGIYGYRVAQKNRLAAYQEAVTRLEQAGTTADGAQFEELYEACVKLRPDLLDAAVQKAQRLFRERQYDACETFIRGLTIDPDDRDAQVDCIADLYYILGNCCYEQKRLGEAADWMQQAASLRSDNPDYFRDLAIVYAQDGAVDKAQEILDQADRIGLTDDHIALVEGEILLQKGERRAAVEAFQKCRSLTTDEYVRMRAYLFESRAYEQEGLTHSALTSQARVLEEARSDLPQDRLPGILEQLAQTYIHLFETTDDRQYASEAVTVLEEIRGYGWGNVTTDGNIVILCQRAGYLKQAEIAAAQMKQNYPDRYETYKRLAFLEIVLQEQKDAADRDYHVFGDYYDEAVSLYGQQGSGQDMEMQVLEDAWQQVRDGGWL